MSCQVAEFQDGRAILTCTTSGMALAPIFAAVDEALEFEWWLGEDPRKVSDIVDRLAAFRAWRPDYAARALLSRIAGIVEYDGSCGLAAARRRGWSFVRLEELRAKGLITFEYGGPVTALPIDLTDRGAAYCREFC